MNSPRILDAELRRVALTENLAMENLMEEIARLLGCSTRQIYNYRSGKWELPTKFFPALCKRFHSLALVDSLRDACTEIQIEIPESFDLTRLVSSTIRDDLRHYEKFLTAFDSDGIDGRELDDLRESGARIIQNVRQFEAIAVTDYERRRSVQWAKSNGHPTASPAAKQ